jgi:hypothetical protein
MTPKKRNELVRAWCAARDGARPRDYGGREKEQPEALFAYWIRWSLAKGYDHCAGLDYDSLVSMPWWCEAVDQLKQPAAERDSAIPGWRKMTTLEQSEYITKWSANNKSSRPKGSLKDPAEKLMASWLGRRLKKGEKSHARCLHADFLPLRAHKWWCDAVDNLLL